LQRLSKYLQRFSHFRLRVEKSGIANVCFSLLLKKYYCICGCQISEPRIKLGSPKFCLLLQEVFHRQSNKGSISQKRQSVKTGKTVINQHRSPSDVMEQQKDKIKKIAEWKCYHLSDQKILSKNASEILMMFLVCLTLDWSNNLTFFEPSKSHLTNFINKPHEKRSKPV